MGGRAALHAHITWQDARGGGGHEGREEMATRGEGNMGGGKKWLPACCDLTTGTEL